MLGEITEQQFYTESAHRISTARTPLTWQFWTKTPTMLLLSELSDTARTDYREEIIRACIDGRLKARYCFAWGPTVEKMVALFSPDPVIRERQRGQLREVKGLVDRGSLDLRYCPHMGFQSGITDTDIAMIHRKDSTGLQTVSVRLATDRDAVLFNDSFLQASDQLTALDAREFRRLVEAAKVQAYSRSLAAHLSSALAVAGDELLALNELEALVRQALGTEQPADKAQVRRIVGRRLQLADRLLREHCVGLILDALDVVPEIHEPTSSILDAPRPPAVPVPIPPCPKLFFRIAPQLRDQNAVKVPKSYPFLLLEQLLIHGQSPCHYANGFFIFDRWLQKGPLDARKRFAGLGRQLRRLLHELLPSVPFRIALDKSGEAWRLESSDFSSDVGEAVSRMAEATSLMDASEYARAAEILGSLSPFFSSLPHAAVLLVSCWRNLEHTPDLMDDSALGAVEDALNQSSHTYRLALSRLRKRLRGYSERAEEVVRDRRRAVREFEASLSLARQWLGDEAEVLRGRRELGETLRLLRQVATLPIRQRGAPLLKLISTSFGQDLRVDLWSALGEDKDADLASLLNELAPKVSSMQFADRSALEAYFVKLARAHLDELQREGRDPLSADERKLVNQLRRAEKDLACRAGGKQASDEALCERLRWTREQLRSVRALRGRKPYMSYMDNEVTETF